MLIAALGALASLLVAMRPLASGFWGHDAVYHLVRIAQWHRGVMDGVLYPRFLHDVFWGHGGPVMIFYPPGAYVVSEIFTLVGAGPTRALELATGLSFVAGAAALYLLARPSLGAAAACVAAAAFTLAPYHLLDAWVRAAYAELVAMAIVPFLLLAARRAGEQPGATRAAVLGLSSALVILVHTLTAIFTLPLAAAYGLWHARSPDDDRGRRAAAGWLAAGLALGAALSAFFWIPALLERRYTVIPELFPRAYQPDQHLLWPRQLVDTRWGFGGSGPGPDADRMSFQIGLMHLLGLAAGALLACRGPRALRRELRFWLGAVAVSILLTLDVTAPLWRIAPALPLVQFPWRLLMVPAIGASLCVGALVRILDRAPSWQRAAGTGAVAALTIAAYAPFANAQPARMDDRDFTPQALSVRMACEMTWLPRLAARGRGSYLERLTVISGSGRAEVVKDITHLLVARVRGGDEPAVVRAAIYAYPGWGVEIDGKAIAARADEGGAILLEVPPGEHEVRLSFGLTPLRRRAAWVSLLALAAVAVSLARPWRARSG